MAIKQTAGRDALGNFAPKFAELNDDVLFGEVWSREEDVYKRQEHFPGHQALVCTHPDGHSHTENIHVHIVINSLRIAEVPMLPHMDRPADRKAGCKHRCTDAAMNLSLIHI